VSKMTITLWAKVVLMSSVHLKPFIKF